MLMILLMLMLKSVNTMLWVMFDLIVSSSLTLKGVALHSFHRLMNRFTVENIVGLRRMNLLWFLNNIGFDLDISISLW